MPVERAVSRLERILVMVPWIIAQGTPAVDEVCARFGIGPAELSADLDLLFVCGLPPFGPGDLVEAFVDGGRVVIRMADWLSAPMPLSQREALALLVSGRALARLPGFEEADALRRALAKLERALAPGEAEAAQEMAGRLAVDLDHGGAELLPPLREAISQRQRLDVVYWSGGRDEMTRRRVDPLLVFGALGRWYLVAQDGSSGEERVFRVDRIRDLAQSGERFEPPEGFDPSRYAAGPVFTPAAGDIEAVIEIEPSAAWVQETVPAESVETLPGGRCRLRIRTAHLPWLVRLLLSLGDAGRAVSPPDLAEGVRVAAAAALARYGSPADPSAR